MLNMTLEQYIKENYISEDELNRRIEITQEYRATAQWVEDYCKIGSAKDYDDDEYYDDDEDCDCDEAPRNILLDFIKRFVKDNKSSDVCTARELPISFIPEETFQERLFKIIDERGVSNKEVYTRAQLDRKLFSKIQCNKNYRPTKKTALALCLALELDLETTKDLLERAELALSPSNIGDLIIQYYILNETYDIFEINNALDEHDQPTLG